MRWPGWLEHIFGPASSAFRSAAAELEMRVSKLPLEEARARVQELLANERRYVTHRAPLTAEDMQRLKKLPSSVRDLFEQFAAVQEQFGDTKLSRDQIGPSEVGPAYTRIGTSDDFTEVVVGDLDDTVYRLAPHDKVERDIEQFPSVYHLLLFDEELRTSPEIPDP